MYNLLDKISDWAFKRYMHTDNRIGEIWWRFVSDMAEEIRDRFPAG